MTDTPAVLTRDISPDSLEAARLLACQSPTAQALGRLYRWRALHQASRTFKVSMLSDGKTQVFLESDQATLVTGEGPSLASAVNHAMSRWAKLAQSVSPAATPSLN